MHIDIRTRSQLERTAGHTLRAAMSVRNLQIQGFEQVSHTSNFPDVPPVHFKTDALLKGTMIAHRSLLADRKLAGNNARELAAIRLKYEITSAPKKVIDLKNRFLDKVFEEVYKLILLDLR